MGGDAGDFDADRLGIMAKLLQSDIQAEQMAMRSPLEQRMSPPVWRNAMTGEVLAGVVQRVVVRRK